MIQYRSILKFDDIDFVQRVRWDSFDFVHEKSAKICQAKNRALHLKITFSNTQER